MKWIDSELIIEDNIKNTAIETDKAILLGVLGGGLFGVRLNVVVNFQYMRKLLII